jgi:hypothetical protein
MRSALLAMLALSVATPAVAASEAQRDMEVMAETLKNPRTQDAMAGAMGAMLGAILDMRVDGIAKALEPLNGGKKLKMKGKTIREMAERKDPDFEDKMEDRTRAAVGGMGALASAMAIMLPQLEDAARKMGDALPDMKNALPDAR